MGSFLTEVDGFTPVIDVVVNDVGLITAVVYGAVWRYCQMSDGVCKASLESIGERIHLSRSTVFRHVRLLCENGYLADLTPQSRTSPHIYKDTGMVKIAGLLSARYVTEKQSDGCGMSERNSGMSERNSGMSERNSGMSERHTKIHDKIHEDTMSSDKPTTPPAPAQSSEYKPPRSGFPRAVNPRAENLTHNNIESNNTETLSATNVADTTDAGPPRQSRRTKTPVLSDKSREFLRLFSAKRFANVAQREAVLELERKYPEHFLDAARWAAERGVSRGKAIAMMRTALPKWGQPKLTKREQQDEPAGFSGIRDWLQKEGLADDS